MLRSVGDYPHRGGYSPAVPVERGEQQVGAGAEPDDAVHLAQLRLGVCRSRCVLFLASTSTLVGW